MEKNMKILLIEDLPSDAELAERELRKQLSYFTVTLVDTKEDFVHALQTAPYDLIISDYKLPSFDGLTALKITREMVPHTPFIILTGSMNEDTAVECMKAGADDYVIKEHIKRLGAASLKAIEKKKIDLERHNALIAQKESEIRFRSIFNQTFQFIGILDVDGTLVAANQTSLDFIGMREFEVVGRPFWDTPWWRHSRELQKWLRKSIPKVLQGEILRREVTHVGKKGIKHFFDFTLKSVVDENEKVLYLIPESRDITERKKAIAALQESEARLSEVFKAADNVAFITADLKGKDTTILGFSPGAEKIFNYTAKEVIGKKAAILHPPDVWNTFKEINEILVNNEKGFSGEIMFVRNSGELFPGHLTIHPRFNASDELVGTVGVMIDITELKQKEKEYKQLIDAMNETAFVIDYNGKFMEVNRTAVQVLGYSREELLSMGPANIDPYLSVDEIGALIERMKYAKRDIFETQHKTKAGKIIPVEISSSRVTYQGQDAILTIARDITERKIAEEQIKKELKEKNVLLREIHHRTKNNLQTICSLLQLQQDTIRTKEDAIKSLEVSQDRILAMAKAYEILLQADYISKVTIGDYIISLAKQLKNNYDIHNKITVSSDLEEIELDTEKLSKLGLIMNEILTNAMKYAFKGREKGSIHISVKEADDHVEFKVIDDGVGIPKDINTKHPASLGLSLVEMLTYEFNGTYSIERKNGTIFTLKIPKENNERNE